MAKTISDLALDLGVFALDRELENGSNGSDTARHKRPERPAGVSLQRNSPKQIYVAKLTRMRSAGSMKSDSDRSVPSR